MPNNWIQNVRYIQDGEQVNAAVTGRPDRDIEGQVRYLRDLVDTIVEGRAAIGRNLTVATGVGVGQPVYYDVANQRFDLAQAGYAIDGPTGTISLAPSADVLGVCYYKHAADLADIVFAGSAPLDISLAAGSDPAPGRYYLSSAVAGGLTLQSPAISVPVLYLDGQGRVYVNPLTRNFLTDHVHCKFDLVCAPAGTTSPPAPGGRHVISAADTDAPGWLPADDASFDGLAPVGAAWGYNLAQHPQLQRVWPPVPVEASVLFWDKGEDYTGGTMVPLGTAGGLAVLDRNGIWWMSDCNGMVPWPADYDSGSPPSPPGADTDPPTCPPPKYMRLVLGYSINTFATRNSVVTRLTPGNNLLSLTDPDGNPATTGPLTATVNLALPTPVTNAAGGQALKSFSANAFSAGWVAEGLKLSGGGLTATATHVDNTDPAHPLYQGVVTLQLAPVTGALELVPQVVRLDGAEEDVATDLPYYRLPAGRNSTIYLRFDLPTQGLANSPTFIFRSLVLSTATGTLPALPATYRRIARPAGGGQVAIGGSPSSLTFTTGQSITAFNAVEISGTAVSVAAGDVVLVTLSRAASDGFGGDVGLVRAVGLLGGS